MHESSFFGDCYFFVVVFFSKKKKHAKNASKNIYVVEAFIIDVFLKEISVKEQIH